MFANIVVQLLNHVRLFVTPWTTAHQVSLSFTTSWNFLRLMSIERVKPFNHLILCHPSSPPAFNLCQHQGLFQWVGSSHRWPMYWSFSFSISPSNEYSGLISFRIDWFDLVVQGPRDSQESSLIPQLESINSSALSLLYCPNLTSIHNSWKNNSFDYMDLCQQSNVSAL